MIDPAPADSSSASPLPREIRRVATPVSDIRWIVAMVLALAIPAMLTLATIRHQPQHATPTSSPYGYTVSLLLFAFPVAILFWWRWNHPKAPSHRRAFFWSAATIALLGFLLDFVFGYSFFVYPNPASTLGIRLPSWNFATMTWVPDYLPIEEFGFYILGAQFVLGVYMWADALWLADYHPDDFAALARRQTRLLDIHWQSVALLVGLALLGIVIRKLGPRPEGLPGYYLFIIAIGFAPTVLLLNGIRDFVNWRAFGFAFGNLLLVSLLWEATLGVPYGWWNYRHHHMLGIDIRAWSNLPIEAVLLWLVIAWVCVIVFEFFRVVLHMDRPIAEAMLGARRR